MHQVFDAPPDIAFVMGLLADLERGTRLLEDQLGQAKAQAQPHDAAFELARKAWFGQTESLRALQVRINQAARGLAEANSRCSTLLQEVANLNRKSEEQRIRMQALSVDSDAYRLLRRGRATLAVQLEDRNKDLAKQQAQGAKEREKIETAHKASVSETDAARASHARLKALQALQPAASVHLELFGQRAAQAHALAYLDAHDLQAPAANSANQTLSLPPKAAAAQNAWKKRMVEASRHIVALYEGLGAGRYSIEAAASWAGGRSVAASEALYALVATGELEAAIELFGLSSADDAFFHHIFQAFRGGCLGLFLVGRHNELGEALRLHQDAQGIRGAYVQAYGALLEGDEGLFHDALMAITVAEWRLWRKTPTPGLGLVNVTVLGLVQLGQLRGFRNPQQFGPTVPWILRPH